MPCIAFLFEPSFWDMLNSRSSTDSAFDPTPDNSCIEPFLIYQLPTRQHFLTPCQYGTGLNLPFLHQVGFLITTFQLTASGQCEWCYRLAFMRKCWRNDEITQLRPFVHFGPEICGRSRTLDWWVETVVTIIRGERETLDQQDFVPPAGMDLTPIRTIETWDEKRDWQDALWLLY